MKAIRDKCKEMVNVGDSQPGPNRDHGFSVVRGGMLYMDNLAAYRDAGAGSLGQEARRSRRPAEAGGDVVLSTKMSL